MLRTRVSRVGTHHHKRTPTPHFVPHWTISFSSSLVFSLPIEFFFLCAYKTPLFSIPTLPSPMFSMSIFSHRDSDDLASCVPTLSEPLNHFQFYPEERARTPPCGARALPCDSSSATWDNGLSCDDVNSKSDVCLMSAPFYEQESLGPSTVTPLAHPAELKEVRRVPTPPDHGRAIAARSSMLTNNYLCGDEDNNGRQEEANRRRTLLSPIRLPAVPALHAKQLQDLHGKGTGGSGSRTYFYYTDVLLAAKRSRAAAARHASAPHAWTRPVEVTSPRRRSVKPFCTLPCSRRQPEVTFTEGTVFIHACKPGRYQRTTEIHTLVNRCV
ncbi:hypothetical protein STCU_10233 [Strigomonas culicis]|uniref:Uncharacterized protein n=1 Tax=Strigomonas culicis TaxID=28005 RepID=S9TNR9_9TRYP|nr:hypothetical protein STCU_10233 [Strigomonas culicis]|eukprot:EPY18033.1 hypothetical protein STCU_10233 [Strigomonas culicis]